MYHYFQKYKLLFIVYGILAVFAVYEIFIPKEEKSTSQSTAQNLLETIDQPDSFHQYELKMYPDRPQADYLRGMLAFKESQNELRKAQEANTARNRDAVVVHQKQATEKLKEARAHYETAIKRGIVSTPELYSFYAITMKTLHDQEEATEAEFQAAIKKWRKHYPLSNAPPMLKGY